MFISLSAVTTARDRCQWTVKEEEARERREGKKKEMDRENGMNMFRAFQITMHLCVILWTGSICTSLCLWKVNVEDSKYDYSNHVVVD